MSSFLWSNGHLGWPLFTLVVFSIVWLLVVDLLWRRTRVSFRTFASIVTSLWAIGAAVIVAVGWP